MVTHPSYSFQEVIRDREGNVFAACITNSEAEQVQGIIDLILENTGLLDNTRKYAFKTFIEIARYGRHRCFFDVFIFITKQILRLFNCI